MRSLLLSLVLLLSCSPPIHAQPLLRKPAQPPLEIDGEVTLIVTKLPFRVVCPEPADLYFWRLPAGWVGVDGGASYTVTSAPQGSSVVNLQTLKIDWDSKKTLVRTYNLTVNVGVGPPPPPVPPPGPNPPPPTPPDTDKELVKTLTEAYAKDFDLNKALLKSKLSGVYTAASKALYTDGSLKTLRDVDVSVRKQAQDMIGVLSMPTTRGAIGVWLHTTVPHTSDTPLDSALQTKLSQAFLSISKALDAVN